MNADRRRWKTGGRSALWMAFWLASLTHSGLDAQAPYNTASGKSTTYAFYGPPQPPVTKAPTGLPLAPYTQGTLPVVSPSQRAADQAMTAPYVQSSFSSPPVIQVSPPVVPRAPGTPASPILLTPTQSFQGIQEALPQQQPPSPDIAAGPSDVILVINSSIAQYTKTGTQVQLTAFQDFFSSLLPTICPTGLSRCQIFDPSIRYDQLHGRFLFLATSRTSDLTVSYNLIAVTNGATYNSGWKIWALNAGLDGATPTGNYADFWRPGFDNRAVYLAGNLYNVNSPLPSGFEYAKIRVLLKSDLYNLTATSLPYQDLFKLMNADGSLADSITPVHQRGMPSAVNSQLLVNTTNFNLPSTFLTVWKIVDPTANPVVAMQNTVTGLLPYTAPSPAPQLNWPAVLDAGDARTLKAVYRDGFLYTARDTGYTDVRNAATTVTFDVIDTSRMALVSQARLLNTNSFYPAFDVPATVPAGTQYATADLITGTTTAPDGSAAYAGISNLKAGQGIFDLTGGLSFVVNRWGDYFGGAVDPINGGLWTSGEYAATPQAGVSLGFAGVWGTWAGYFPWLTTSAFTDVAQPFADYANVLSLWGITSGCTATTFCPTATITRGQFATFIIRSMEGSPCPNNTPCTAGFTYTAAPYFTDVLAADSDFPYVQKLRDLGITSGCTATTFCPNDMVPRWAAAVLIVRGKLKALLGDSFTYPSTPSFEDVAPSSSTFSYIQKLFELGITTGCTATTFCPDDLITRQQAAVFIVRAFLN